MRDKRRLNSFLFLITILLALNISTLQPSPAMPRGLTSPFPQAANQSPSQASHFFPVAVWYSGRQSARSHARENHL